MGKVPKQDQVHGFKLSHYKSEKKQRQKWSPIGACSHDFKIKKKYLQNNTPGARCLKTATQVYDFAFFNPKCNTLSLLDIILVFSILDHIFKHNYSSIYVSPLMVIPTEQNMKTWIYKCK